jgi:hypothetical protein
MIKLSFKYSKEFELGRIKNTIKRLDWYLANGYNLGTLSFPKNVDTEDLSNLSDNNLALVIGREYDENKFVSSVDSIRKIYEGYEAKLEKFIIELGLKPITEIKIYLTKYGIGGSYHSPNEITVNIDKFFSVGLMRAILHEIIHLHIEPLIQKYKIDQWQKETVVNLLFERAFPDIYKKQNIPMETKKIENIFNENYPNIENIISKISR